MGVGVGACLGGLLAPPSWEWAHALYQRRDILAHKVAKGGVRQREDAVLANGQRGAREREQQQGQGSKHS